MIGTGTTWGLSGATFLWLYVGLCVAVAVAVRWQWQRALGTRPRAERVELDVYRLAMLNGGPQLTITAAAARLHRAGVLREGDEPRSLVVDAPLDADAHDVERAVFDAVEREPHIRTSALRRELADSEPVTQLASRLADVGLLLKSETVARMRRLWVIALPLIVLGAARLWAGIEAEAPVGFLAVAVVAVALATVWLACRRPWATARGQAVVARERASHRQLSTGGTTSQMPLAVALYGGAALWAAEPAIASAWDVPRETGAAATRGPNCGGGWSGGGITGGGCGGGGGGGCGGGCGGGGG